MRIILSRLELLAGLMFASNDDVRFTLNSICVEVSAGARPLLISTDGRRLAVIESQAEQIEEFDAAFQMLLRADFVRPICALSKAFGGKLFPWIQFECKPGSARVQVTFIGGKCFFEAEENALVEGAFPNWRACVPPKNSVRTPMNDLGINSEFMGDFARAGKILNAPTTMIQLNLVGAESAIEVKIPGVEWFYALVMPCKVDATVDYQPEFLGIVTDLPMKQKAEPEQRKGAEDAKTAEVEDVETSNIEHSTSNTEVETGNSETGERVLADRNQTAATAVCDEDEEIIQQCIEVIRSEQNASVSLLQRRLRLGYRRANKIMYELERRGIVGPSKGSEPRDILIDLQPAGKA